MSTTPHNVLQLARQGNPDAIAALMNQHLQARGITAQVTQQDDALNVFLESAQALSQEELVAYVQKGVTGLSLDNIHQLNVSGKQVGHTAADWTETIQFNSPSAVSTATPDNGSTSPPSISDVEEFDLEAALAGDEQASSADFDLDMGAFEPVSPADDLDLVLEALANGDSSDVLDLDLGASDLDLDASNLDLDSSDLELNFDDLDSPASGLEDLDLGLTDSAADSSSADSVGDFDLGSDALQGTADELDAVLSDLDIPGDNDPDNSWTETSLTEDELDLDFNQPPGSADSLDLDLELDTPAVAEEDSSDLDLDIEAAAVDDLDLDLDLDMPAEDNSELNLDFEDASSGLDSGEDDLDLEAELNLAGFDAIGGPETDTEALDLEIPDVSDSEDDLDLEAELNRVDSAASDQPAGNQDFVVSLDTESPETSTGTDDFDFGEGLNLEEPGPSEVFDSDLEFTEVLDLDVSETSDVDSDFDVSEDRATSSDSLASGESLEGDLWVSDADNGDTSESSFVAFQSNDIDWETDDIEWEEESPIDSSAEGHDLAASESMTADIDWEPVELIDSNLDSGLDTGLPSPEDGDTAPELDLSELGAAESTLRSTRGAEPVDLMLSEEFDLSAQDNETEGSDFAGHEQADAGPSQLPEEILPVDEADSPFGDNSDFGTPAEIEEDLDIADASSPFAAPQSPVNKLLSEEDFSPFRAPETPSEAASLSFEEELPSPDEVFATASGDSGEEAFAAEMNIDEDALFTGEAPADITDNAVLDLADTAVGSEADFGTDQPFTDEAAFDLAEEMSVESSLNDASGSEAFSEEPSIVEAVAPAFPAAFPEPGLRPEDFPLFNSNEEMSGQQANVAEPVGEPVAADGTPSQPDVSSPEGKTPDLDTLELEDDSADGDDGDISADEEDFPMVPVESFDDLEPLGELGSEARVEEEFFLEDAVLENEPPDNMVAGEIAADTDENWSEPAPVDPPLDSEVVSESEWSTPDQVEAYMVDDWGADADDWDDTNQTDATDEFMSEVTDREEPFVSTSVNLTEADLDHLDNRSRGGLDPMARGALDTQPDRALTGNPTHDRDRIGGHHIAAVLIGGEDLRGKVDRRGLIAAGKGLVDQCVCETGLVAQLDFDEDRRLR
jgi:hypothetical protein